MTFEVCPFFWDIIENCDAGNPYYFYNSFLFCFFINYFITSWKENFNHNRDLLYKFISFLFKPFVYIFNFIFNELKRFFNFITTFKYKKIWDTLLIFFKKIRPKSNLVWRPIFKKWSYFGFFKTNKSKWWK